MKKSTKLLSLILAIVMLFSSLGITSFAAVRYPAALAKDSESIYDGNDKAQAYFLTDEQRASYILDMLDGLLLKLNITTVAVGKTIDLRSVDSTVASIYGLKSLLAIGTGLIGELNKLNLKCLNGKQTRESLGDPEMISLLLTFLDDNAIVLGNLMDGLNSGVITLPASFTNILNDIPGLLKGMIYDAGVKRIANGFGEDPDYPHQLKWVDVQTKPVFDDIIKNLIVNLLTKPLWECHITDKAQNTFSADPLNASLIHSEIAKGSDGKPLYDANNQQYNYFYLYVDPVSKVPYAASGMTDENAAKRGIAKTYLTHYDKTSIVMPDFDATGMSLKTTSLYQILDKAIPVLFDKLAGPALNADLRTVLLKLAGAKFEEVALLNLGTDTVNPAHTAIFNQVSKYAAMTDVQFAAEAKTNPNLAGTPRYFFVKIGATNYNVVSKITGQRNTKIYSYSMDPALTNNFADIVNWDYQIGTWSELITGLKCATPGTSVLKSASDLVGKIINAAIPVNAAKGWYGWALDDVDTVNENFTNNLTKAIKFVIKEEPGIIMGEGTVLPGDFDSYSTEKVLVYIAADVMNWLMPTIVLPKDVQTIEELVVYGVRELMAEIYPEFGKAWDAQIKTAAGLSIAGKARDNAFLDIALNMGMSAAVYYLKNFIGFGSSKSATANGISIKAGPSYNWKEIASSIIDGAINNYAFGIFGFIKSHNAAFNDPANLFGRLDAIVNALAPNVLTVVSGCGNSAAKQFSTETLFSKITGLLNGDVVSLVACVYRNDASLAGKGLAETLLKFLIDFVEGLGFASTEITGDWFGGKPNENGGNGNGLKACFTNALNNANPFDWIVQKQQLNDIVRNLVYCITDKGSAGQSFTGARGIWVQNACMIVMMATGALWEMQYKGAKQTTDKPEYFGSATPVVNVNFELSTSGVHEIAYTGGFKSGEIVKYGEYSAVINRTELVDLKGNIVQTITPAAGQENIAANVTRTIPITIQGVSAATGYTITTYYQVKLPDGSWLGGKDNLLAATSTVFVGSAVKEKATQSVKRAEFANCFDVTIDKIAYLDEFASLGDISATKMYFVGAADKYSSWGTQYARYSRIYMAGLGNKLVTDPANPKKYTTTYETRIEDDSLRGDGTTYNTAIDLTLPGQIMVTNEDGTVTAKNLGTVPFWPNALISYNQGQLLSDVWGPAFNYWAADPGADRTAMKTDFTAYRFEANNNNCYAQRQNNNKAGTWLNDWKWTNNDVNKQITQSTLVVYNSYALGKTLNETLNARLDKNDYTTASWNTYTAALEAAAELWYRPWPADAEGFRTMIIDANGNNKFQMTSNSLKNAIKGLTPKAGVTIGTSKGNSPEELAVIKTLADEVKQAQAPINNYKNYALYTYKRSEAAYNNVMWQANRAVAPTGVADKTLVGTNLGTTEINELVNQIADAKYKTIVGKMVKEPTPESAAAAAKAKADWDLNPVRIDMGGYQVAVKNAIKFSETVVGKYTAADLADANKDKVKYFLQDAVNLVNAEKAAGKFTAMTAESVARLETRLAEANTILANAQATHSSVHEARYALLIAYKNLVGTADATDFTGLEASIKVANDLLAKITIDPNAALDPAVENLIIALGYKTTRTTGTTQKPVVEDYWVGGNGSAKAILEDYKGLTGNTEFIAATKKALDVAIAAFFKLTPTGTPDAPNSVVTQKDLVISGVNPATIADKAGLEALVKLANVPAGITANPVADFAANGGKKGTGAQVKVVGSDGTIYYAYTLVIFGDVNGDGTVDVLDAFASNGKIANGENFTGDYQTAADLNKNGYFDADDYSKINGALAGTPIAQK